jgi:hypothetical protein
MAMFSAMAPLSGHRWNYSICPFQRLCVLLDWTISYRLLKVNNFENGWGVVIVVLSMIR